MKTFVSCALGIKFVNCISDAVLSIQNGKYISRSKSQETAKSAKHTLAPNSFSEYLKILAVSIKTSLVSLRARMIAPMRKKQNLFLEILLRAL